MKKDIKLFPVIFLLIIFNSCKEKHAEIQFMNLYATTIIEVKCEDFKQATDLQKVTLNRSQTNKLLGFLENLKPASSDYTVDARLSGTIYNGSEQIDICMSSNIINVNNKRYFVGEKLREYVIELTKK